MNKFTEKQARKQLGEFNNEDRSLEWCVQDMRLASQTLVRTIADARIEIAVTNRLVSEQMECIERQRKEINELKEESPYQREKEA